MCDGLMGVRMEASASVGMHAASQPRTHQQHIWQCNHCHCNALHGVGKGNEALVEYTRKAQPTVAAAKAEATVERLVIIFVATYLHARHLLQKVRGGFQVCDEARVRQKPGAPQHSGHHRRGLACRLAGLLHDKACLPLRWLIDPAPFCRRAVPVRPILLRDWRQSACPLATAVGWRCESTRRLLAHLDRKLKATGCSRCCGCC